MRGVVRDDTIALVVVELEDVAVGEMRECGRELVFGIVLSVRELRLDAQDRVAYFGEELGVEIRGADILPVLRIDLREVFFERLVYGAVLVGHSLFDDIVRKSGHDCRVGAACEHDLVARALALALFGELGVGFLELFKLRDTLVGRIIGKQPLRIVDRPVVLVDEAGFHSVGFLLLEKNGVGNRAVDPHALANHAFLYLVADGCFAGFEHHFQVFEPHGFAFADMFLRLAVRGYVLEAFLHVLAVQPAEHRVVPHLVDKFVDYRIKAR